jgi:hypothetical protein
MTTPITTRLAFVAVRRRQLTPAEAAEEGFDESTTHIDSPDLGTVDMTKLLTQNKASGEDRRLPKYADKCPVVRIATVEIREAGS